MTGVIDRSELPKGVKINDDGDLTMEALEETYPTPSLNRIVMKIEDNGTGPIDGQRDHEKLREAYLELGSWLRQHDTE